MGKFFIVGGPKSRKPVLSDREMYFATDTQELIVGAEGGDVSFFITDKVNGAINHHFMGAGTFKFIANGTMKLDNLRKVGPGGLTFYKSSDLEEDYVEIEEPSTNNVVNLYAGNVLKIVCDDATGNTSMVIGLS